MKKIITVENIQDNLFIKTWTSKLQLTKQEARALIKELKPHLKPESKYRNEKITAYGREWDSKIELEFYEHLVSKWGVNKIIVQPKYELQEKVYHGKNDPRNMLAINYVADFSIDGTGLVFDVKGATTKDFLLKFKLFKAKYPDLQLSLITRCPKWLQAIHGEWIDLSDLKKARIAKKKLTNTVK